VAGALAQVKTHVPLERAYGSTTAVLMAQRKKESDAPQISELRFRRMLQAADLESFYAMLRRTLPLLSGSVDVPVLANDIWLWGDRFRGDRQRRQWAYDYYAELPSRQQAG
jgi:CRISPR system Cascade subunit CasB